MNRAYIARLCLKDCDLAAPRGALNLIKGTRTFTQHLEREWGGNPTKHYVAKHKTSVLCVSCYGPCVFLSFCLT